MKRWLEIAALVAFMVLGCWPAWSCFQERREIARLENANTGEAELVDSRRGLDAESDPEYYLTYQLREQGFVREQEVTREEYDRYRVSKTIPVKYDAVGMRIDSDRKESMIAYVFSGLWVFGIGGLLSFGLLRKRSSSPAKK